jgi:hypothetical protein
VREAFEGDQARVFTPYIQHVMALIQLELEENADYDPVKFLELPEMSNFATAVSNIHPNPHKPNTTHANARQTHTSNNIP